MATDNQILLAKSLRGKNIIRTAMKHNLREIQADIGADSHIDAKRTRLNIILAGAATSAEVAATAKRLMIEAGIAKPRKNGSMGIEIVFSLPADSQCDQTAFFQDALAWAVRFYDLPVLSAVIHNDEAAPHMHVILLPLVDGRMQGNAALGGKAKIYAAQATFFAEVGQRHGLTRPKPPQRIDAATRAKSASLAVTALQSNPELLDRADIESLLLATVGRNPEPWLAALKLSVPHAEKREKAWVATFINPCVEKKQKAIAVSVGGKCYSGLASKNIKPLCSVSGLSETPSITTAKRTESTPPTAQQQDIGDDFQRVRDNDHLSAEWDSDRGEYVHARASRDRQTLLYRVA